MTLLGSPWEAGLTHFEKPRPTEGKANSQRKFQEFSKHGLNTKSLLSVQAAEPPLSTSPLGKGGPPPRRGEGAPYQSLGPEPSSLSFSSQRGPPLSRFGPPPRSRRDQPPPLSDLSPRGPSRQRDASILAAEKVATTSRPHHSAARVASLAGSRAPPPSNRTAHCRHRLLVHGPAAPLSLALAAARRCGRVSKGRRNRELKAPARERGWRTRAGSLELFLGTGNVFPSAALAPGGRKGQSVRRTAYPSTNRHTQSGLPALPPLVHRNHPERFPRSVTLGFTDLCRLPHNPTFPWPQSLTEPHL